ncbi:MAG: LPXTG cell wall anchor domain-containing protein [Clostridia bacterium]|nr:LPXTG cell wall anchor domain-containing protein [Clostridia bacterium]
MEKLSVKKLLVLFTLIAIVCMFVTTVKASGPINLLHPPTTTNTQGGTTTNTQGGTTTNTQTPITTTNTQRPGSLTTNTLTTNTTPTTNEGSNLPKTGDASDYIIFLIIAVSVVVAIYAFRKYKYFNI